MDTTCTYDNPWLYNGQPFESEQIGEFFGFVYCITNIATGKKYIGRKYFGSLRKPAGKKKRKRVRKESDWKSYYGSSKALIRDLESLGVSSFRREILSLHKTKGEVNYFEVKTQFKNDVLEAINQNGERLFYNDNIANRYFTPRDPHYKKSEEHKKKISETHRSKGTRPINCDKPRTEETKRKLQQIAAKDSHFIRDNPNDSSNIAYKVVTPQGIKEIVDLPQYCKENNINYNALRVWSKSQPFRRFEGKIKQTQLHKKYQMKIISYKNTITRKTDNYHNT